MANEYPILDGIAPSWADLTVTIKAYAGGEEIEVKDIAAINSGVTVEVGEQRGTGGRMRRRTRGQGSYEGSIEFYRAGYQKFLRMLASVAPLEGGERVVSLVHFDVFVQHILPESSDDPEIYGYKIMGARGLGRQMNSAEGVDADKVEVPLSVGKIVDVIDGNPIRWI